MLVWVVSVACNMLTICIYSLINYLITVVLNAISVTLRICNTCIYALPDISALTCHWHISGNALIHVKYIIKKNLVMHKHELAT